VQNVLHYSAIKTGLTFFATAGTLVAVAAVAQGSHALGRAGAGCRLLTLTAGMIVYAADPRSRQVRSELLPATCLVGIGPARVHRGLDRGARGRAAAPRGRRVGAPHPSQQIGGAVGTAWSRASA